MNRRLGASQTRLARVELTGPRALLQLFFLGPQGSIVEGALGIQPEL